MKLFVFEETGFIMAVIVVPLATWLISWLLTRDMGAPASTDDQVYHGPSTITGSRL